MFYLVRSAFRWGGGGVSGGGGGSRYSESFTTIAFPPRLPDKSSESRYPISFANTWASSTTFWANIKFRQTFKLSKFGVRLELVPHKQTHPFH